MTTKLLAICVAVFGLGSFAVSEANASEVASMPSVVRVNQIDVQINSRHRHHYYGHHHYRTRRVYYRHGHRYYR